MRKKGLSPLIATVILISIAVALGVIVLDWGRSYIKDTTKYAKDNYETSVACKMDVELDVVRIDGADQICYMNTTPLNFVVDMIIENKGRVDVYGVEITTISIEKEINLTKLVDLNIKRANPYKFNITHDNHIFENLSLIQIAPIINGEDGYILCNNKLLEVNGVEVVPCDILG